MQTYSWSIAYRKSGVKRKEDWGTSRWRDLGIWIAGYIVMAGEAKKGNYEL
jgi:hypothetical protein